MDSILEHSSGIKPSHTTPEKGPKENSVSPFPKQPMSEQFGLSTKALGGSDLILHFV